MVSLDSLLVNFNAKVNLSGQFSTMTRGYYLYQHIDSNVNPLYHRRICDINNSVSIKKCLVQKVIPDYPFAAYIQANYASNKIIDKTADKTYSINLENWFIGIGT